MIDTMTAAFRAAFGAAPTVHVTAPGRVNLIGEHTDYNDGFVLPCAIERGTQIVGRPRDDGQVRVLALDYGEEDAFALDRPVAHAGGWRDYVRGTAEVMRGAGFAGGADLAIAGDLPQGVGLSSSASLEVAIATLLSNASLSSAEIAQLAQRAENEFVGMSCGIMDQMASAAACAGHALLLDCRDLSVRHVPIPADWAVMIVHSGVERGLVDSAYNERRAQCETAARFFGVSALRDVSEAQLVSAALDPLTLARARHVVTENARTVAAADALASGDLRALTVLMRGSHASMRDNFAITTPAIDALVALVDGELAGNGGARMTGGGFGGCIVAVMRAGEVARVQKAIETEYRTPAGEAPMILVTPAVGGAKLSPL